MVSGNNRGVHLGGSYYVFLLRAGVSQNDSLHIGDALLDHVITRGNVAERGIGVEVCVLVACRYGRSSVGYHGSVIIADTAREGVVVALYCTGVNVYGVLARVEHIVLRENVCVSSRIHAVGGLTVKDVVVHVDVRLTCQGTAGFAVLPIVVVVGQVILKRGVGRADKISLMISVVIAIGVGEVLTALEVAGAVTAGFVALCGIGNNGSVEGTVVDPASLNGCCESRALLLSLHTYTVLGNVLEGDVSHLEALAVAFGIIRGLADEVQSPTVHNGIGADTLDGDILTARHSCHVAVVANASAVVNGVVRGKTCRCGNVTDDAHDERRAVLGKLADNARVGVGDTALGVFAASDVSTDGVEYVSYTADGGAVLRGHRYGVLIFLGYVEDYRPRLKRAVVVVCAHTLGVVEMCITRAIVCQNREDIRGECQGCVFDTSDNRNDLDAVIARLKTYCIYAVVA